MDPMHLAIKESEGVAQQDSNSLYQTCKTCPKEQHCCYRATTIVVLPEEAKKIVGRTGCHDYLREDRGGLFTIVKQTGLPCPFLTKQGLCGIYDIRPIDCRSWPLTINRASSAKDEYLLDMGCPAAQQGNLSQDFMAAAKQVLGKIELNVRADFVELVHRDSLPLVPLSNNAKDDKAK